MGSTHRHMDLFERLEYMEREIVRLKMHNNRKVISPGVLLRRTTDLVSVSGWNYYPYDSGDEVLDGSGMHTSNGLVTAPRAGRYDIRATIRTNGAAPRILLSLRKNATTAGTGTDLGTVEGTGDLTSFPGFHVSTVEVLDVGDTVIPAVFLSTADDVLSGTFSAFYVEDAE